MRANNARFLFKRATQACTFDCSSAKAEPTDRTGTIEASISTVAEETTIVAVEARGYGRYPLI